MLMNSVNLNTNSAVCTLRSLAAVTNYSLLRKMLLYSVCFYEIQLFVECMSHLQEIRDVDDGKHVEWLFRLMIPCDKWGCYQCFGACSLHWENGGSRYPWKVGNHLPDYTLLYPGILRSTVASYFALYLLQLVLSLHFVPHIKVLMHFF